MRYTVVEIDKAEKGVFKLVVDYATAEEAESGYEDKLRYIYRHAETSNAVLLTLNHGSDVVRGCFFGDI